MFFKKRKDKPHLQKIFKIKLPIKETSTIYKYLLKFIRKTKYIQAKYLIAEGGKTLSGNCI